MCFITCFKHVIYLGAKKHRFFKEGCLVFYNDIVNYEGIDYCCDMLDVDLDDFDVIIATQFAVILGIITAWQFVMSIFSIPIFLGIQFTILLQRKVNKAEP